MPRHLPAGLTQFALHAVTTKSPPSHVTSSDVSIPPTLIDVAKIIGHQLLRGRGGALAVFYETHWKGLLRPIGNANWIFNPSIQTFLPTGRSAPTTASPIHGTINNCTSTQLRVKTPTRKANATSQALTASFPPTYISPGFPRLPYPSGPSSGITPSTAPSGWVKRNNPPTSLDAT